MVADLVHALRVVLPVAAGSGAVAFLRAGQLAERAELAAKGSQRSGSRAAWPSPSWRS